MRLLVAGRSGQVAQALAGCGAAGGVEIICLGRPELDLADPGSLGRAIERASPDVVINAAAYTAVDKAETEEVQAFAINGSGAGALAAACESAQVPIIHISTDYVFDGEKDAPYLEGDATRPVSAYGRTKLQGEDMVAAAAPHHLIVRTSWVFSPFGQNFVKTMLRLAESRNEIGVVADQIGTPTYAPHLAAALLELASAITSRPREDVAWGVYHLAGQGEASWHAVAAEVFRQSALHGGPCPTVNPIPTSAYPTPARRPKNSRIDCGKLERNFGVRLPDWHEGIAECVKALSGHPAGETTNSMRLT